MLVLKILRIVLPEKYEHLKYKWIRFYFGKQSHKAWKN